MIDYLSQRARIFFHDLAESNRQILGPVQVYDLWTPAPPPHPINFEYMTTFFRILFNILGLG